MLAEKDIIDFCNKHNYDIRLTKNGRWIDQKCTADVLTVIADCIDNFINDDTTISFNTHDIWHSDYAINNVSNVFKKPGVKKESAKSEYDKFFQQPMKLFSYAGILTERKQGNTNFYSVKAPELLEYIALREKNSLKFLQIYIEKVLKDSGISNVFESYFKFQTKKSYNKVKKGFSKFTKKHTKINGKTECNRIFTKVLNPIAYLKNARGTKGGKISNHIITYDMLMYNRDNFRDIYVNKPKGVTRKEFAKSNPVEVNEALYKYQSEKAKRHLRRFNDKFRDGRTEHYEETQMIEKATQMHHIFSKSEFREICYYIENIIALTPTQHMNYAHPNGNPSEIDEQYQHLLLLSKTRNIEENLKNTSRKPIYSFDDLLLVLMIGFDDDDIGEINQKDFCGVVNSINSHYK